MARWRSEVNEELSYNLSTIYYVHVYICDIRIVLHTTHTP